MSETGTATTTTPIKRTHDMTTTPTTESSRPSTDDGPAREPHAGLPPERDCQ
ncbi:hypothetical protein [Halorhabdus rudnickae]|uniref:hypothetical protein n=1 Tax=Halorhabdus rudnickae TaxID=1775544 RepID=UPI00143838AD|nr:hypothetical protein [Halorhabdus rudnickae]